MLTAWSEAPLKVHHTLGWIFVFLVRACAKCIIFDCTLSPSGRLHVCEAHPHVFGFERTCDLGSEAPEDRRRQTMQLK